MSTTLTLDLRGRRVLVLGGGVRAARRVSELIEDGADAVVHAEVLGTDLREAHAEGRLGWSRTPPTPTDVASSWLVCLCTDEHAGTGVGDGSGRGGGADEDDEHRVARWARESRVWCEGLDAFPLDETTTRSPCGDPTVNEESTTAGESVAVADPAQVAAPTTPRGRVVLVGGGPGADDLITVRGLRELARADVVVVDRLAPTGLLHGLGDGVEIVDVGKTPYHHPVPQHEIDGLLVDRARRGQYVVRLKGGDPFVLGRGGEEWAACREAGVPVDVVPGVSSAFAAPLAGLVPVTYRGVATGVLTISGHDDLSPDLLTRWPHTIVILMGMGRLAEIAASLVQAGKGAQTPVAVIHRAYSPDQRVVRGNLADIAARIVAAGVGNPAVIVVGKVVEALPYDA
ncbi:uroporphyrinogen-III C-methyltransferase [Mobilicoccus sp.]|uniref:uroporphyrinogen-III C-methyltransferase n=1 Tax=Mobilicoccus sp. TaxID=2034349 RepID=UPI0028ACDF10|nr:uroporphyrinogen-III C-methyltransferase [Mobilicoccus sp.]